MRVKVVFLDRDGVINTFPGIGNYVTRWKDFRFLPNTKNAIKLLAAAGFEIHIISNQGCVAKGLITPAGLRRLTDRMIEGIKKGGGEIKGVFYCMHETHDHCDCKKPKVKLFKKALRGRSVDLGSVYFVGDSEEDVKAGKNLGCRTLLVLSGRTKKRDVKQFEAKPDVIKRNLWDAARWITRKK